MMRRERADRLTLRWTSRTVSSTPTQSGTRSSKAPSVNLIPNIIGLSSSSSSSSSCGPSAPRSARPSSARASSSLHEPDPELACAEREWPTPVARPLPLAACRSRLDRAAGVRGGGYEDDEGEGGAEDELAGAERGSRGSRAVGEEGGESYEPGIQLIQAEFECARGVGEGSWLSVCWLSSGRC